MFVTKKRTLSLVALIAMISAAETFAAEGGGAQTWGQWAWNQLPSSRQIGYHGANAISPFLSLGALAAGTKLLPNSFQNKIASGFEKGMSLLGEGEDFLPLKTAAFGLTAALPTTIFQANNNISFAPTPGERDFAYISRTIGSAAAAGLIARLLNAENPIEWAMAAGIIGAMSSAANRYLGSDTLPEEWLAEAEKREGQKWKLNGDNSLIKNRLIKDLGIRYPDELIKEIDMRENVRNTWPERTFWPESDTSGKLNMQFRKRFQEPTDSD